MRVRHDPHAVIEITKPGSESGEGSLRFDSYQMPRLFKSIDVDLPTNESAMAEWSFFDPKFKVIDAFAGSSPVEMSEIRIFLGFGQDLGEPIFKGLLAHVHRTINETRFTAFDMGFKMKLVKKAGYKNKKDDIAIIRDLTTRNGLKFQPPAKPLTLEPHNAMMQDESTDWEHVLERARDAGLVVWVREDTLFVDYPAKVDVPVITLRNRDVKSPLTPDWDFTFRTPESQDGRPRIVKVRGRGKGGKQLEGKSDEGDRGRESVILKKDTPGKPTKSKLSKRAQAQKELDREHAFEGRIGFILTPDTPRLDVRKTVAIEGVGKLFSAVPTEGKPKNGYVCDRVAYRFAPGRMAVDLDLYRDIAQ